MTTEPIDLEGLMAAIDALVEHAREDDRMCYDQIPSQRYTNARDMLRAVLARWGAQPAPEDSVLEDAARWQMAVLIGNEVMLHPDKRSNPAAVKAYMDAVHSGLDLTGAVDAARKQGANHD